MILDMAMVLGDVKSLFPWLWFWLRAREGIQARENIRQRKSKDRFVDWEMRSLSAWRKMSETIA